MAYSGSIGSYGFDARKIIDHAFLRCRIPLQGITSEMIENALDTLHLVLSEMGNGKSFSWAVDAQFLPFYQNNPKVVLPLGTLDVLRAYRRLLSIQSGTVVTTATSWRSQFDSARLVTNIGIKWSAASTPLTIETSADAVTWVPATTWNGTATAGEITWINIPVPVSAVYIRVTGTATLNYTWIKPGINPVDTQLGIINREAYFSLSDKTQTGQQPVQYWYERDIPNPVLNVWPVATQAVEEQQICLVYRNRHIMDTQNTRQDVEVPQRWQNAIIDALAYRLGQITPSVDLGLMPMLLQNAQTSLQAARDGDNDGSTIRFRYQFGSVW